MTDPVRISALDVENVKRVNAVAMRPTEKGLTVIGGKNNQGKTSVLDAIAWALGGDRMRPDSPRNSESVGDPYMRVELSNGIVVERKGKNSSLKVIDPSGNKAGQKLLDSFIEAFALDLPRFMESSDKEKADALLNIIGVGSELADLDQRIDSLYNKRLQIGQIAKQKRGAANEMERFDDAPDEPISAMELIQEQQGILARNGENQRKREQADAIAVRLEQEQHEMSRLSDERDALDRRIRALREQIAQTSSDLDIASKTAEELVDESTEEIERRLAEIDATNERVRTNQAKRAAEQEAAELEDEYSAMSVEIEDLRAQRMGLLEGAALPLPGLSVQNGRLTYNGRFWDDLSGSEQLRVATAIARALKPECGFVLVDKLEQMDLDTLAEFAAWAQGSDLQVIGTRVSSGDECSIVIQDGYAEEPGAEAAVETREWEL